MENRAHSERDKMLAGELYDPLDPELVSARTRARDLCQALNATREAEQERRGILRELFGAPWTVRAAAPREPEWPVHAETVGHGALA